MAGTKFYAVKKGRQTGIFRTWDETKPLVNGFNGALYKSFKTYEEASDYMGTQSKVIPTDTNVLPYVPCKEHVEKSLYTFYKPEHREMSIDIAISNECNMRESLSFELIELLTKQVVYYTDGSCVDKIGGYGFVAITLDTLDSVNGRVPSYPTTNQVAELYAIMEALLHAERNYKDVSVLIFTDSKYSIGCLTVWCHNWKRNGWINSKGKPVENQDIIKRILGKMGNMEVKFKHVKAHNGDKYNEMADRLANEGRFK